MFIHFVRFTTPLPHEQVRRLFEERAPRYREVPGLLQKYYGYDFGDLATTAYLGEIPDGVFPVRVTEGFDQFAAELLAGEGTRVFSLLEARCVVFEEGGDLLLGVGEDLIEDLVWKF